MIDDQEKTKLLIQKFLGKEILSFELKGKGACNNAYYVETNDGKRYIIKEERSDKETDEQNDLAVEGKLIKNLSGLGLSIPLPKIVFVSKNPKIYGYEYIEGDMLSGLWKSLSEKEKICIFRSLGLFHAELGEKFTKKMSEASGIEINMSPGLHPEVVKEYERLVIDDKVPKKYRDLVQHAKEIFEGTFDKVVFQFIHNDAHHENVLIKDKKISGIIDFGNAEYGELAKEFSRYIRDYPDHFQHIVAAYEESSGNKLSYERLVSNSMVSGFVDVVENYWKGGEKREKAEEAITKYGELLKAGVI